MARSFGASRCFIFLISILVLPSLLCSCGKTESAAPVAEKKPPNAPAKQDLIDGYLIIARFDETNVAFDHWFTWKNWDDRRDKTAAAYVFDGEELGQGDKGRALLVEKLSNLKEGERLLLFPSLYHEAFLTSPSAGCPLDEGELKRLALDKKFIVIDSLHDNHGALHAQYVGKEEQVR